MLLKNALQLDAEKSLYQIFKQYYNANIKAKNIIFGCGDIGLFMKKYLEQDGIKIYAFCDNALEKQGNVIKGIPVLSLSEVDELKDNVNLIINDSYYHEKELQVERLNNINIKTWRFDAFNPIFKNFDKKYISDNLDLFEQSYNLLEDIKSKDVFISYLNGVCTGDLSYYEEIYTNDEYFPKDIMPIRNDHVFLDVGAYNGNTAQEFIEVFNKNYEKIYCFEPIKTSSQQIEKLSIKNLELYNIGASDHKGECVFYCNDYTDVDMATSITTQNDTNIECRFKIDMIDNILDNKKATFIKMDIEGSELSALKGAEKTIKQNKPFMAICVYHKREDLITILSYIKSIVPEYKFYLKQHSKTPVDLVLYCVY